VVDAVEDDVEPPDAEELDPQAETARTHRTATSPTPSADAAARYLRTVVECRFTLFSSAP
jgi:hypothetical protein